MTTSIAHRPSQFDLARQAGQGELNVFNDNFFLPYGITYTPRSLTLPHGLPQDDWVKIVTVMLRQREMLPFHIADALRFGEQAYGVSFSEAVEMAGASERLVGELLSLQRVAPTQRRQSLSEDHHLAVASLPPAGQDFALGNAERFNLSVAATRLEVEGIRKQQESNRPDADKVKPVMQRVSLTVEAIFAFAKGLSFEEQHRLSALLDKNVRTFGTGQIHMDGDIETSAMFDDDGDPSEMPEVIVVDLRGPILSDSVEMVPFDRLTHAQAVQRIQSAAEDIQVSEIIPYVQPDLTLEQRVLGYIELTGGASNPMLYKFLPGESEKSIRDVTKRLLASGAIKDTGRRGESSSSTPPALWGLAAVVEREQSEAEQWREDVIDAEFNEAEGGSNGTGSSDAG